MGRQVIFTCDVTDEDPYTLIDWIVDVPTLDETFDTSAQAEELIEMGFVLGEQIVKNSSQFHINLTIPANAQNNNTEVTCRSNGFELDFGETASLKVLGEYHFNCHMHWNLSNPNPELQTPQY